MNFLGWRITRVKGQSMIPVLNDGDFVIGRHPKTHHLQPGQIVLVDHPEFGHIIKCLGEESENGFSLYGLSPMSTSSEKMGVVAKSRIITAFFWRVAPEKTFGALARYPRPSF